MNITPLMVAKYDHLIVHVTATPASMTDVDALWVDRVHRRKGWSGCGYHAVILRDGTVQDQRSGHRTRPYNRTGAHVGGCGPGWNERSIGVSLAGGVKADGKTPEDNLTTEQKEALWNYIAWATEAFDIPMANVMGHRDLIKMTNAAPKACPCFSVRSWLDEQRTDEKRSIFKWNAKERPPLAQGDPMRTPRSYTVQKDDTLWGISNTYGSPVHVIKRLNRLNSDLIRPGQRLRLVD